MSAPRSEPIVVWSRFNRGIAIAMWAFSGVLVISLIAVPDARYLSALAIPVALCVLAWNVYWRPRVVIHAEGVELMNVSRTVWIPWELVTNVTTRYALTVHTESGRYPATGAPAPGAYGTYAANRELSRDERRRPERSGSSRPSGELAGTDSGVAYAIMLRQWGDWSRSGAVAAGGRVTYRWHPLAVAVTVTSAIVAAVALVLLP